MKTVVGHVVIALVLALAGSALWMAGQAERRLVDTHMALLTLQFPSVAAEAEDLVADISAAARAPWLGAALRADARENLRVAGYWMARYQDLDPDTDAAGTVIETDPQVLLLAANAAFRAAQADRADREALVRRYEAIMASYADVLRLDPTLADAAYNYEFVVRLRDAAARPGRRALETTPPPVPTMHGIAGAPPESINMGDFKIVVPKRMEEREEEAQQPGGEAVRTRKG